MIASVPSWFDQDIHCVGTTITWQLVFVSFAFFGNVITHATFLFNRFKAFAASTSMIASVPSWFDQDIHCVGTTITWQLVFVSFAFFGNVITHAQLCARKINKYIHIFGNQSTLTAHYSESRSTWLVAHVSEKSPIFRGITSNLHSRFFSHPTRWTAKA